MLTIDISRERAEDMLAALARVVDPSVPLGRPLIAQAHADGTVQFQMADPDAWWWLTPAGRASRLLPLVRGRAESTEWREQEEVSRVIGKVS